MWMKPYSIPIVGLGQHTLWQGHEDGHNQKCGRFGQRL